MTTDSTGAIVTTPTKKEMAVTDRRKDLWETAKAMAASPLVPDHFRNKPADCFIMADLAERIGAPVLCTLQETFVVHGKPAFSGKLCAALLEGSGRIDGPIDYVFAGEGDDYGCHAVVHDRKLDKQVHGPLVTWKVVKGEGWDKKSGSKWKTMPDLMFRYRAASWLCRAHYAGVLMGMSSTEELHDVLDVESKPAPTGAAAVSALLEDDVAAPADTEGDFSEPPEPQADPSPEDIPVEAIVEEFGASIEATVANKKPLIALQELEKKAKGHSVLSKDENTNQLVFVLAAIDGQRDRIKTARGGKAT